MAVPLLPGMKPIGMPTRVPALKPLLEVGGDELANSTSTLQNLPYLPFLGADGYFVRGWSHLISGSPRVGKTELLKALVKEWLDEGLSVLYITEEPQVIWESRINGSGWSALRVVFGIQEDVGRLLDRAGTGNEDIVVVDSLRTLLQLDNENDNSEIARAVNPWISAHRDSGKTLILVHHNRKSGGDHGQGIAGGTALLGSFDIAMEIKRDDHVAERRVVQTYARLIESKGGPFMNSNFPQPEYRKEPWEVSSSYWVIPTHYGSMTCVTEFGTTLQTDLKRPQRFVTP